MKNIENSTIEQLENDFWPQLTKDDFQSYLITTIHKLRSKRIGSFEVEDLRIMIGNGVGMKYLVPKAIRVLTNNILAGGDFYEGDLLKFVLHSEPEYWKDNNTQWRTICELFESNRKTLEENDTTDEIRNGWFESYEKFKKLNE